MDFAAASKIAGARFVVLRGALARLERALGQFMLDLHTREHAYTEMVVPSLVNDATAYGTDKLPKFADTMFQTTDGRWLIPTAEVPLTTMVVGRDGSPRAALPTAPDRADRLLPQRGGRSRARHPRHAAPAPVPQGRDGFDHASGPQRRGARADDALRGRSAAPAGSAVPARGAEQRRHRLWRRQDLRSRGLAAGPAGLARDQFVLQHPRLPGAAHERSVPRGGRQGCRPRAHAERLRRRGRSGADRGDGEPPAGRRIDPDPEVLWPYMGGNAGSVQRIAPQ